MSHLTLEGYRGSVYCPVVTGIAAIVGPKLPDIASVQVGAVDGKQRPALHQGLTRGARSVRLSLDGLQLLL